MKNDEDLTKAGFTESGRTRYLATANDYCVEVFEKAVAFGDRDKAQGMPREVTHEHVRSAAVAVAERGRMKSGGLQIFCQVGEYLCAILAGLGAGKLDQKWGIFTLVASAAIGVVLFVIRSTKGGAR